MGAAVDPTISRRTLPVAKAFAQLDEETINRSGWAFNASRDWRTSPA
jgi:hypothetical protein